MAEALEKEFGITPQLIKSGGGVFEVEADGILIFSKTKEYRFPSEREIIDKLKKCDCKNFGA